MPRRLPVRYAAAIVALSGRELALFFPGSLQNQLEELLPAAHWIDPLAMPADWDGLSARASPEIILSGWHTPPLLIDSAALRYVCHIAGSVRRHVPRVLLERGVLVSNWGETVPETVAEGALSLILAALRRTQEFGRVMHQERGWQWLPAGTQSLFDRRVGLHGFGSVARSLIPMLRLFRCPVKVFTTGVPAHWYVDHGVERAASLDELFGWSDVVIEAEALTSENRGAVNEALLRRLRRGSVFVNVGRGGLVDEAALARVAAENGLRLGLDVFDVEPLPVDSPLRGLPDAVLSPHLAGPTDDRVHLCGEFALRNIERYLAGETPEGAVSLAVYDRAT